MPQGAEALFCLNKIVVFEDGIGIHGALAKSSLVTTRRLRSFRIKQALFPGPYDQ